MVISNRYRFLRFGNQSSSAEQYEHFILPNPTLLHGLTKPFVGDMCKEKMGQIGVGCLPEICDKTEQKYILSSASWARRDRGIDICFEKGSTHLGASFTGAGSL